MEYKRIIQGDLFDPKSKAKLQGKLKDQYVDPVKKTTKGFSYLTLEVRRKLQNLLSKKLGIKEIAFTLNISRSTIYYERMRMGSLKIPYDAEFAHKQAIAGQRIDSKGRVDIPKTYKDNIGKIYRNINSIMGEPLSSNAKRSLKQCLILLEKMGADPNKMKKPVTAADKEEILKLWKEGHSLTKIESITGRARSTIFNITQEYESRESLNTEEILYNELHNKWINKQN